MSIGHMTYFLNKYIYKGATDMKFSPDIGNNPSHPQFLKAHVDW